jgi:LPXTG-site transpeptidase (sortase) family protein
MFSRSQLLILPRTGPQRGLTLAKAVKHLVPPGRGWCCTAELHYIVKRVSTMKVFRTLMGTMAIILMCALVGWLIWIFSVPETLPISSVPDSLLYYDTPVLSAPTIHLRTPVNTARVIDGYVDRNDVKVWPALIDPSACNYLADFGEPGVSLVLGHRQWLRTKLVFADIDKLEVDDKLFVFYGDKRFDYKVMSKTTILPTKVWDKVASEHNLDSNVLMLVSCAPYGNNTHRLIVTAKLGEVQHFRKGDKVAQSSGGNTSTQ